MESSHLQPQYGRVPARATMLHSRSHDSNVGSGRPRPDRLERNEHVKGVTVGGRALGLFSLFIFANGGCSSASSKSAGTGGSTAVGGNEAQATGGSQSAGGATSGAGGSCNGGHCRRDEYQARNKHPDRWHRLRLCRLKRWHRSLLGRRLQGSAGQRRAKSKPGSHFSKQCRKCHQCLRWYVTCLHIAQRRQSRLLGHRWFGRIGQRPNVKRQPGCRQSFKRC